MTLSRILEIMPILKAVIQSLHSDMSVRNSSIERQTITMVTEVGRMVLMRKCVACKLACECVIHVLTKRAMISSTTMHCMMASIFIPIL